MAVTGDPVLSKSTETFVVLARLCCPAFLFIYYHIESVMNLDYVRSCSNYKTAWPKLRYAYGEWERGKREGVG